LLTFTRGYGITINGHYHGAFGSKKGLAMGHPPKKNGGFDETIIHKWRELSNKYYIAIMGSGSAGNMR